MTGKTATRGLLALTSIEDFAAWAKSEGYERQAIPPKAQYEVLRLAEPGKAPILFFRRTKRNISGNAPKHCSTDERGKRLVLRWINERKRT